MLCQLSYTHHHRSLTGEESIATSSTDKEIRGSVGVLQQLTADDLKELGVSLLGHRRKLLTAIEGLRAQTEPSSPATDGEQLASSDATAVISPERRHLTVKRPGFGIAPKHMPLVVGRTARVDIEFDDIVTWEMV